MSERPNSRFAKWLQTICDDAERGDWDAILWCSFIAMTGITIIILLIDAVLICIF